MRARTDARRRAALAAAASLALASPVVLPGGAPAASEPALERAVEAAVEPTGGAFDLEGRGFGHGRGMSQWGAQGAAISGVNYRRILRTYYPGTAFGRVDGSRALRVHLTADDDGELRVRPGDGLRVRSGSSTRAVSRTLPQRVDGAEVSAWRVTLEKGAPRLAARAGGEWRTVSVEGKRRLAEPVRLRGRGPDGVRLVLPGGGRRDYRGELRAVADSRGVLRTVNKVRLESYLRSVVPSESFPSWEPAALRAQSVAARTYALWKAANNPLGFADICDTTACQVYQGIRSVDADGALTRSWEVASTDAAIRHTAGRILRYRGEVALTEFSASNGGHSTAGHVPYLVAKPDRWDGAVPSNAHSWIARLSTAALERRWPEIGDAERLEVLRRDGRGAWGGRVLSVRVAGAEGVVTVLGTEFAAAVGLKHSWWRGAVDSAE